ncbi:non-specific lipid-transfer protein 1-like [Corylus avellana]|uniref:non-specific lipid-transfer protein 1-like n=1 Tax=Corylus avellana TaxID=13451 RepID=UPI00286BBED3|nr:non-specific lipid-transfer protein 1-like [Corylus avellana]
MGMAKFAAFKKAYTIVVIVCMLMANSDVEASLSCPEITTLLAPCIPYAIIGGAVPTVCCKAVTTLDDASNTVEEDRAACSCIMSGLSLIPGINYDLVSTLPEKCNHTCPYTITATTDCSKVQ